MVETATKVDLARLVETLLDAGFDAAHGYGVVQIFNPDPTGSLLITIRENGIVDIGTEEWVEEGMASSFMVTDRIWQALNLIQVEIKQARG